MNSLNELKEELIQACKIQTLPERSIQIAALLAEALRSVGQDPILVGGTAVEFYTEGGYSTLDIDMLAPGGPELFDVMSRLGFERFGKDFTNDSLKVYVEFPGAALQGREKDIQIQVGKHRLRVISIEDLIVDRLCAFKYWQSAIEGLNTMKLLESGLVDPERIKARTQEEGVSDALRAIQDTQEEIIRKKLPPKKANLLLEKNMKKLKVTPNT